MRHPQTFENIEESKWNSDQLIWPAEIFRNLPLLQKTCKDMKYLAMNFKFILRVFQMLKDLKNESHIFSQTYMASKKMFIVLFRWHEKVYGRIGNNFSWLLMKMTDN